MSYSRVNSAYACASCSGSKRRCPPRTSPGSRCTECEKHMKKGRNDSPEVIEQAPPFPSQFVEHGLLAGKPPPKPFERSFNNESTALHIDICGDSGRKLEMCLDVSQWSGNSPPDGDHGVSKVLENIRRVFSPAIKFSVAEFDTGLVSDAILAGGIFYILCSTTVIAEQVRTYIGQNMTNNEHEAYRLEYSFRLLLVSQLKTIVKSVTDAIRTQDVNSEYYAQAYTAAILLHYEAEYFIKRYHPHNHIVAGLEGPFVQWVTSVNQEMLERVREGCGRVPHWRSGINESIRKFHERRRKSEKIQVTLHLQRNKAEPDPSQMKNWPTPPLERSYTQDVPALSPSHQVYSIGNFPPNLGPSISQPTAYPSPPEFPSPFDVSELVNIDYGFASYNNNGEPFYSPLAPMYYDPIDQNFSIASFVDPYSFNNPNPYYYY